MRASKTTKIMRYNTSRLLDSPNEVLKFMPDRVSYTLSELGKKLQVQGSAYLTREELGVLLSCLVESGHVKAQEEKTLLLSGETTVQTVYIALNPSREVVPSLQVVHDPLDMVAGNDPDSGKVVTIERRKRRRP